MLTRRDFLAQTGGVAAAMLACGRNNAVSDSTHPAVRPNILWIYSDDHAENAVSAYGGRLSEVAPTPNIDRIAREGMLFRNSFVTNSICGPCRAVVLTGLHSHLNGFRQNGDVFDGSQQTFPKLLRDAGYHTALFGKWHLESEPTGFDTWEILPGQGHYYNPDFITPEGQGRVEGYVTDVTTDKALRWLEEDRDRQKPFLLMVHHKAPHRHWEPGPDHLTTFKDVTMPEPDTLFDDYAGRGTAARTQDMTIAHTMRLDQDLKVWEGDQRDCPGWQGTYGRMNETQRAAWDAAYDPENQAFREAALEGDALTRWKYQRYLKDYLRCVASIDDNVGRLLDYLEETGLDRNTVVFYSSDQSFYLGEHGWFDKRFIYEESLRTPLVVRWPGVINPGSVATRMVQNLDCAPTFLDIAGVDAPAPMQGASLLPLMQERAPEEWRQSIYYHYYEGPESWHAVHRHYGVRTERYKLVYFYELDEWEFYDLEADPQELNSAYDNPAYADNVGALKKELARLRAAYQVPDDQ